MGEKRFSSEEEELLVEKIRRLLLLGHSRKNIFQALHAKYPRCERQFDRYLAQAQEQIKAFGSEPTADRLARIACKIELLYAQEYRKQEPNAMTILKIMDKDLELTMRLKESQNETASAQTNDISPGLSQALPPDEGERPSE